MNVLFVTENLFPDVMGGSGRVVAETGRRLATQGHAVHVVSRLVEGAEAHETRQGLIIHRYAYTAGRFAAWRNLCAMLNAVAAECVFDVIVVCQPFQGLAVLLSSPLRGIPVVRDFYGPWHDEYRVKSCGHMAGVSPPARVRIGMALRKWADTHVLRHVDHVRVLSDYTADVIRTICPGHAPITTIPAGINLAHFSRGNHDDARYSLNLPLDRPLIFTVRNLTPRMGLDVLIEATARVKEHLPNVLTVIGGDGFLRAELERQAARAGLDGHVRFAGRIAEELLPTFYRAADVFVLPTQALEGFGLVTLEAMACGTPVLATPNGGTLEILGPYGHTFLLEQADVTAMAGRLTELLTDPDKRRAMGAQARMIAEKRFDANVCAKVFGDFLARVAGRTKKESDT